MIDVLAKSLFLGKITQQRATEFKNSLNNRTDRSHFDLHYQYADDCFSSQFHDKKVTVTQPLKCPHCHLKHELRPIITQKFNEFLQQVST